MSKNDFLTILKNQANSYHKPILYRFLNPQEQKWVHSIFKDYFIYESNEASEYRRMLVSDYELIPDFEISVLKTSFRDKSISHRDVLGSLMTLGLKRDIFGDITITEDEIYVEVISVMVPYVKELTEIKRDTVLFELADNIPVVEEKKEEIVLSLDSLRVDAIIAKAFLINREDVKILVNQDRVKINFILIQKHTIICKPYDIISVRGFGRIRLIEVLGQSKKQKTRIKCELLR